MTMKNDFEKFGWKSKYGGRVLVQNIDMLTGNSSRITIEIQNGPRKEVGDNGVDVDVLGELWLDILKDLNSSEFRCRETSITITKIEEALMWQQKRRENREKFGVEGTNLKHIPQ
jgi:hypothetical protein